MKKIIIFVSLIFVFSCTNNNEEDFFGTECDTNDVYYITSDESRSVFNIITNKCIGCHGQDNSLGIVSLATYQDLISVNNLLDVINLDINNSSAMPPAGMPQLTDCEKSQLTSWVNNGYLYDEAQR